MSAQLRRNAEGKMGITEIERRKLWVRSGGRCVLCKEYLLEGNLTAKEVSVGEAAHIVGREKSEKSARGMDSLDGELRDLAENLMLACASCHNEIDKLLVAELLDKNFLLQRKLEHENEIRHQTSLTKSRRTVIFRMAGDIRGGRMELPKDTAIEAVIKSGGRFPVFPDSYDQYGVEVDLRDIDGEENLDPGYYMAAMAKIDKAIERRLHPGVLDGEIRHLSVFALARLPLLIYLGSRIDDGIPAEVYQRHRATQNWVWSVDDPGTAFNIIEVQSSEDVDDAALILNVSGVTPIKELPDVVRGSSVFRIDTQPGPSEDAIIHPAVLGRFEAKIRDFFTGLEISHKGLKRLHLIGAIPISPAVTLGRVLKSRGIRPKVVTYDRVNSSYIAALEV